MLKINKKPLVVIVGETGSGKSALAMELALKFDGEIIAADSRTVYKQMDIGTAKPNKRDQAKVKHHLLNEVEPNQKFSAANFKKLAVEAINNIHKQSKLPILVGGTGLYIDSVIYNYEFKPSGKRDPQNPRHLLASPKNAKLRPNTIIIGLKIDKSELEKRIAKRVAKMIKNGLISEVSLLLKKYPEDLEAFKAPGYRAFIRYQKGLIDLEQAKTLFAQYDLNLAKRQRTWFKRNKSIHWVSDREQAVELVTTYLSKLQ